MQDPVCIIGDSITGGVVYAADTGRYIRCAKSFVNLLGESVGLEIRNHSRFGCTVTEAARRMERFEGDVAACPYTVVMLGGNDSDFDWPAVAADPDAPHDCNTPISDFTGRYEALVARIRALGSSPVLLNMIPVDGKRYFSWFSKKSDPGALMRFLIGTESIEHWNEMYNLAVMKVASKLSLPVLDARSAFLRTRDFGGMFSEDGIHPSPGGHRAIFEYLLPQVQSLLRLRAP